MMNLQQNVEISIKCLEVVDILEIAKWVVLPVGDFVDVEAKAMEVVKATVVAKAMEDRCCWEGFAELADDLVQDLEDIDSFAELAEKDRKQQADEAARHRGQGFF